MTATDGWRQTAEVLRELEAEVLPWTDSSWEGQHVLEAIRRRRAAALAKVKPEPRVGVGSGRPAKMTPSLADEVRAYVEAGMSLQEALLKAGVSKRTWYRWRRTARGTTDGLVDTEAVTNGRPEGG